MELRLLLAAHHAHRPHLRPIATAPIATAPIAAAPTASLTPAKLAFNPQPAGGVFGSALNPAFSVYVEDQNGNLITADQSSVTLSDASGPAGATLSGTVSVQAVNGVATFNNVLVSAAGTYSLQATDGSLSPATSSGFTVTKATPTVTATDAGGSYNGSGLPATVTVSGSQNSPGPSLEGVTPTVTYYSGATASGTPLPTVPSRAGTYTALASFGGSADYNAASATVTFSIAPASLTVLAVGVNKVYDGTTAATVTLTDNHVPGDQVTDSYASASFADKNVGANKSVGVSGISISGPDAANYTLASTSATTTANITKRPLAISAVVQNKIFDGTTSAAVTLQDNRISGDQFTDSYTSATFANSGIGTSKLVSVTGISIAGLDAANYSFNTTATTTGNILPGSLNLSNLVSFTGGADGGAPIGGLVMDSAGNLYGTTSTGGTNGDGTFFEISNGLLTTLASFTGDNGATPKGALAIDASGNVYGTTYGGGAAGYGTVFKFSGGTLGTLASFTSSNGASPESGLIIDASGNLYGTTDGNGNGSVFEIVSGTSAISVLATFNGVDGSDPQGTLTIDHNGNLYGTTVFGGSNNGGALYEIAAGTGSITLLASLGNSDGSYPQSNVVLDSSGDLFGTTHGGGASGNGTVFEYTGGFVNTLFSFNISNGTGPQGLLVSDAAGDIYGTTAGGGSNRAGTVFMLPAGESSVITVATLAAATGSAPAAGLFMDPNGNFFATTQTGGAFGHGAVIRLTPPPNALATASAGAAITLIQNPDHLHVDWSSNNASGNVAIGDPNGLTLSSAAAQSTIFLNYANGDPLPDRLTLNGTFTITNLQGANPLAGTVLDVNRSTVFISYVSLDPIAEIAGYLAAGYDNGRWDGSATASTGVITSIAVASDPTHATGIGYADAADGSGIDATPNTIELKYTLNGDTNLDGSVNNADLNNLLAHYQGPATWDQGDSTYNGSVDVFDLNNLLSNFNRSVSTQTGGTIVNAPPPPPPPPSSGGWSGPIVITQGGTYTGNWQSLNPNTPAVTIATSQPVVIVNSKIQSMSALVSTSVSGANITITNTNGWALNPNVAGQSPGRFLDAENFVNVDLEHNTMTGTAGIELGFYQGNGTPSQTIKVLYNKATNIDGRWSNGASGFDTGPDQNDYVQFCQLNACQQMSGVEIGWNQVINQPGQSRVEDNISIFQSCGTPSSPILIHDNYIQGAYPASPASDASYTGGGIMVSDGYTHSAATDTGWVQAYNNVVIGTSNYGIAVSSGHNDSVFNNVVVSSGLLSDGTKVAADNVGIYVWNAPSDPYFGSDQEWGNTVGWMGASGRNDEWLPNVTPSPNQPSDTFLPGATITLATEQGYYSLWAQRISSGGLTIGAS
ncbi:MAG TPA: choice-of-anchor tandem repeat GloVer-containing protein [Tepidisphaeraceae bacterium]|nr:choice-of-anchor tandem repeat GloVer-containing protein [Tepidisphaeraceae bacterium]